jgi:hypothetical protein
MNFLGHPSGESHDNRNFGPGSHFFDIAPEKKFILGNRLSHLGLTGCGVEGKACSFAVHELSHNGV